MVSFVLLIGLAIALILAAVIDVRESRIPNWLTFSLAGFGMAVHGWHQGIQWPAIERGRTGGWDSLPDLFLY